MLQKKLNTCIPIRTYTISTICSYVGLICMCVYCYNPICIDCCKDTHTHISTYFHASVWVYVKCPSLASGVVKTFHWTFVVELTEWLSERMSEWIHVLLVFLVGFPEWHFCWCFFFVLYSPTQLFKASYSF